jgi:hypothetical protein
MNDGFGFMLGVLFLLGIAWGIIKQSAKSKKETVQKPERRIKQKREPHPEYPEEPDYQDPEDADLIEFDL